MCRPVCAPAPPPAPRARACDADSRRAASRGQKSRPTGTLVAVRVDPDWSRNTPEKERTRTDEPHAAHQTTARQSPKRKRARAGDGNRVCLTTLALTLDDVRVRQAPALGVRLGAGHGLYSPETGADLDQPTNHRPPAVSLQLHAVWRPNRHLKWPVPLTREAQTRCTTVTHPAQTRARRATRLV